MDLIKACYDQAHLAEILPGKGLGRVSSFGASRLSSTHRRRKPTILSI